MQTRTPLMAKLQIRSFWLKSNFSPALALNGERDSQEEKELQNCDLVAAGARLMSSLILNTFCLPEIDTCRGKLIGFMQIDFLLL
jgi:hypothetical protein